MPLQELLEVAIGLIFAWLVLSVATLQVQETIANLLNWRARELEKAIRNMLGSEENFTAFYNHQVIKSLSEPVNSKVQQFYRKLTKQNPLNKKPSYIPASAFATAIFDIVAKAGTEESPIKSTLAQVSAEIEKMKSGDEKSAAQTALLEISRLAETIALAQTAGLREAARRELTERVENFSTGNPALDPLASQLKKVILDNQASLSDFVDFRPYLEQIRAGAVTQANQALGNALGSLLAGAEEYATDADRALAIGRKNVETWFDNSMDRLSGWYKRRAQAWAFGISLFAACLLNIDSVQLSITLWKEPVVRQATAGYVDNWLKDKKTEDLNQLDIQKISGELGALRLPIGWDFHAWEAVANPDPQTRAQTPVVCEQLKVYPLATAGQPGEARLIPPPVSGPILNKCIVIMDLPKTYADWATKILGLLISAGAAMQGAPFWFDILKKLVNVRSTGINPAEKPKVEEAVG